MNNSPIRVNGVRFTTACFVYPAGRFWPTEAGISHCEGDLAIHTRSRGKANSGFRLFPKVRYELGAGPRRLAVCR